MWIKQLRNNEWLPPICSICKVFGHHQGSCTKQSTSKPIKETWQVEWKGKDQVNVSDPNTSTSQTSTSQSVLDPTVDASPQIPVVEISPIEEVMFFSIHATILLPKGGQCLRLETVVEVVDDWRIDDVKWLLGRCKFKAAMLDRRSPLLQVHGIGQTCPFSS
ncbi:hypothetical protein RHMOL_Rhmol05G0177300 [Rhododendron molle]|uniref:Uncharacterized protein n=1 Tax=Rhododendron molle TaxID=49168 RepID=A0ACC0NQG3_RHOML|nr:hypothetical protein RHMOL_Rhmol05G0177300 [Rhododendron molle]